MDTPAPATGRLSAAKQALLAQWRNRQPCEKPVSKEEAIPRRANRREIPLSVAQQQVWFFTRLDPESALYNIPFPIRMTGELHVEALQKALSAFVARHAVLRMRCDDSGNVQFSENVPSALITVVDLRNLPSDERELDFRVSVAEEVKRPFNLERDLLIRAHLFRMAEHDWGFLIVIHHLAADIWSWRIMCHEIAEFYQGFMRGQTIRLPEPRIDYTDYAAWQTEALGGKDYEEHLAFWRQNLHSAPPVLNLPFARPRPSQQTFRGACEFASSGAALENKLRDLSQREGVTLYMTMLAAFQALIYRHTGETDLVMGTPAASRCRAELEDIVGFFANMLILRTNMAGDPPFSELLARSRDVVLNAIAHQEVPFANLVRELHPPRSPNHLPFFQVVFALQEELARTFRLPGIQARGFDVDTGSAKFDLLLTVLESDNQLKLCAEYNTDLFARTSIRRLLEQYQTVLEAIVENPETTLSKLPLCRT